MKLSMDARAVLLSLLLTVSALIAAIMTGCVAEHTLNPPVVVADRTKLDEQAALTAELAYQAATQAALVADRAGLIPPKARPCLAALEGQAYGALTRVRAAYRAGNAAGYAQAMTDARGAIGGLVARKGC